jgi:hypothetical protein
MKYQVPFHLHGCNRTNLGQLGRTNFRMNKCNWTNLCSELVYKMDNTSLVTSNHIISVQIQCILLCLHLIDYNLRSEQSSMMIKTLGWSVETLKNTLYSQPTVAGLTQR